MTNELDIKGLEPVVELPYWCYLPCEWNKIVVDTVKIINGIRYVKKEPEQKRDEEIAEFLNGLLL